jgi:hypothetical protein
LQKLENELVSYLDETWGIAVEVVEKIRKTDKFKILLKLNRFLPVAPPL